MGWGSWACAGGGIIDAGRDCSVTGRIVVTRTRPCRRGTCGGVGLLVWSLPGLSRSPGGDGRVVCRGVWRCSCSGGMCRLPGG